MVTENCKGYGSEMGMFLKEVRSLTGISKGMGPQTKKNLKFDEGRVVVLWNNTQYQRGT